LSPRVDLLGLPLAFAAGGFLGSIVYQASVTDTATLLGLATIVASIGLLASWLPARLALRVNPAVALYVE
jgi:ABC-type antimicrobial peptide transport system permease subunit